MSVVPPGQGRAGPTAYGVIACLLAVIEHPVPVDELLTSTLADVGVESWAFTAFLARVEQEFGIAWDYDVPLEVFQTVQSIADYVDAVKRTAVS